MNIPLGKNYNIASNLGDKVHYHLNVGVSSCSRCTCRIKDRYKYFKVMSTKYLSKETHYEFFFPWEAPIDRPLLQIFESLCRDHKIMVWDFLNLYLLWWFVSRVATSNTPSHSLGTISPFYVSVHMVFGDFEQPTSYPIEEISI